jgi:CheY-like chemotaxis protein/DNA-binding XRE family transcriptional regulator
MPGPTIPELVLTIRRETGESQEALARRLGVSFATVNAWERGRTVPRRVHEAQLLELAKRLGLRTGLSVLAIDDDPASCAIVDDLVSHGRHGGDVITSTSPTEGLLLCGALRPDVLFLDIMMPGLDGFAVAEHLAHIEGLERTAVIFMTASTEPKLLERAAQVGSVVLQKPLDGTAVDTAIATVLAAV